MKKISNGGAMALVPAALFILAGCGGPAGTSQEEWDPATAKISGERKAQLTLPPEVPPPSDPDRKALKMIVNMEVVEKPGRLADGVEYTFWTFGGTVPGEFIRVREGDVIEFHLKNHPDNKFAHNIDLHAVTGPGGGAASSFTAPGHESVFSFRCLNRGLYVYHCATAPVGMHVANGMYGLILVEPKEGLPRADKEYYVMQGDFYTKGKYGEGGLQPFDMNKALEEHPDYVVFNGAVGSLSGDNALKARVGDYVRIYIGNGGPNLVSSFHVIGEIFDKVYIEGGDLVNSNVQTTLVPAGGAAIVEFRVEAPGTFILVDHSIFRAFNKGAIGQLNVEGEENRDIYSGKQDDKVYQPEGGRSQDMPGEPAPVTTAKSLSERIALGKNVYTSICQACHQADGKGLPGVFPPVERSDYFRGDVTKAIAAVVNGLSGPVTVNGKMYNSIMPAQALSDEEAANVVSFVLNSFGNGGGEVTPEMVNKIRH